MLRRWNSRRTAGILPAGTPASSRQTTSRTANMPARCRRTGRRDAGAPSSESGFSVVEALVALAVFAMAGVALVELQAHSLSTLARVETRALASVIAQNKLVDAYAAAQAPDLGASAGETAMAGRNWRWRRIVAATADPMTRRITVDVAEATGSASAVRAQAFVSVSEPVQ